MGDRGESDAPLSVASLTAVVAGGRAEWQGRAAAYDSLRLLLWREGRAAAPALAAQAPALLPVLAHDLSEGTPT